MIGQVERPNWADLLAIQERYVTGEHPELFHVLHRVGVQFSQEIALTPIPVEDVEEEEDEGEE
jgi:hypothetical protein